jgi:uncharacterized Zn finger protein
MELPTALYIDCPSCGEETLHRVIKGKVGEKKTLVAEALVKCSKCHHKHTTTVRAKKYLNLPIIVSELQVSKKSELELPEDEVVEVENEYLLGRDTVKITGIETSRGRVKKAEVGKINTLWAKKFNRLKIKVSINKGSKTLSREIWAVPDEEFFVGDVMTVKGLNFAIHRIKTKEKSIKRGSAEARDIIRLYGKIIR